MKHTFVLVFQQLHTAIIVLGIINCCGADCNYNEPSTRSGNATITPLPKLTWSTEFLQNKVNPNFVILTGISNAQQNLKQILLELICTSLEPIEMIFEETLNSSIENPTLVTSRHTNALGALNIGDFQFLVGMFVGLGHLIAEGSILLQCSYVQNPCLGKTMLLTYHSENATITLQTDDLGSNGGQKNESTALSLPTEPAITSGNSNIVDKPCDAYFYYNLEVAKFTNGFVPYSIACSLKDGTPGNIEIPKIYLSSVFRNSFRGINFQPRKCWKPLFSNDSTISQTTLNYECANCPSLALENLLPIVPICTRPNEVPNTRNSKKGLKIGSFALFGIPRDGTTGIADIILPGNDLPTEAMIRMDIHGSDKIHHILNTTLIVDCVFSRYYLSGPFRFAVEYENNYGNSTTLDFQTGIRPFFLNGPDILIDSKQEGQESLPVVLVKFDDGANNKNITCWASGLPFPKLSWHHLNSTFPENKNGVNHQGTSKNHSYAWSEIQFSRVTAAAAGDYVCNAVNDFGSASMIFRISVTEKSFLLPAYVVSAVFSVILLACGVFAIIQVRKVQEQRKIIRSLTDDEILEFFEGNRNLNKDHPQNEALAKAFDQSYEVLKDNLIIEEGKLLGSGNFGTVMQGSMIVSHPSEEDSKRCVETKTLVAIKTVKSNVDVMHVKALLSEIKIMAFLGAHPNIVQLLGTVTANIRQGEVFVAVEFCANGDLRNYLKKFRNDFEKIGSKTRADEENSYLTVTEIKESKISAAQLNGDTTDTDTEHVPKSFESDKTGNVNPQTTMHLLKWSAEIASGLTYLSQKKIIHGDLAARNVLLTDTKMAKISDFGLSKQLLNDYTVYAKKSDTPLPWKWLALEALKFQNFSIRSDTWSFGVVLWEIFSLAEIPYPGFNYDENFLDKLDGGFRLRQPQFANEEIYKIMAHCWEKLPEDRPDAQHIHEELMNIIKGFE